MFSIGEKISYPMHGAGIIEGIEDQMILDVKRSYYILRMSYGNMKVMVPVDTSEDIDAVMEKDPAARTRFEVFMCYPGVRALMWYRPAHWLYRHNMKFLARVISQRVRHTTGIEIHPGAVIGRRCFIDHGMAVVIGETAEIGDDVTIYQAVTLGGTGKDTGKRHPTIGNNVIVSSGSKVLGPFKVGDNSKIGAGAVVLQEVPPNCTVVGIPGHVVKRDNVLVDDMNQIDLPDPVETQINCLRERIAALEAQLNIRHSSDAESCNECVSDGCSACASAAGGLQELINQHETAEND